MRRTSPWVWVAFAAVQLAALGLCVWAMERELSEVEEPAEDPARRRRALAAAPPPAAADIAFAKHPVAPERPAEPVVRPAQPMEPRESARVEPDPRPEPRPEAARPRFGPPPAAPRYIAEAADATTQMLHARAGEHDVIFGFYPDGNIRCVDVDGSRYHGKAESARARMREDGGTRAFTVQLGVARDGRLEASFTGGLHDGETLPLDPLVGGGIA